MFQRYTGMNEDQLKKAQAEANMAEKTAQDAYDVSAVNLMYFCIDV